MAGDQKSSRGERGREDVSSVLLGITRFLGDIVSEVASSLVVVVLTFLFATAVSAGMLWMYEWPLFLSPVGGSIVLGVMLLFWYDS